MRVLIDTTYARRVPLSGTAVYIERLCDELARLDGVEPIPVANTRRRPPAGGGPGSVRNAVGDLWWAGVLLPRLARRMRAQVIHHPLPAWSPGAGVPQVVTIADLAFERLPDCFDPAFRRYAHIAHRAAARAARGVVCVSNTTARDAVELWGVERDRIIVAPHGPGQALADGVRSHDPAHFLYVGDAEPRKNLGVLLAAYSLYRETAARPIELVVAGTAFAKAYLRFAERAAPHWANEAITDSHAVADIFERRYRHRIGVVPYGVEDPGHAGTKTLERLGLEPRKYILFVGRLEPENNPHLLVEAFSRIASEDARDMKLVIVGGAPYADDYIRQVWRAADPRVVFPGYVFGTGYWELQRHAYLFCAPTEVGGTHPVILEAMAAGNCVLVNDHRPNAETVGDAGVYFSGAAGVGDLAAQLRRLLDDPGLVREYRQRARQRARSYSWDAVTDQYEALLASVCEASGPGALPVAMLDREPAVAA